MCVNQAIEKITDDVLGLAPKQPKVQAPPAQPTRQESKAADSSATIDRVQQAQNSMSGGIANTLYTNATGIDDEQLRLGKKTLLGS